MKAVKIVDIEPVSEKEIILSFIDNKTKAIRAIKIQGRELGAGVIAYHLDPNNDNLCDNCARACKRGVLVDCKDFVTSRLKGR